MRSSLGIDRLGSRHHGIRRRTDHQGTEGRAILLPHRDLDLGRIKPWRLLSSGLSATILAYSGYSVHTVHDRPSSAGNILLLWLGELPGIAQALDSEVGGRILHTDFLHFVRREGKDFFIAQVKGGFTHNTLGFGIAHEINNWAFPEPGVDALPVRCFGPEQQFVLGCLLGRRGLFPHGDALAWRVKAIELECVGRFGNEVSGFEVLHVPEQTVDSVTVARRLHRLFYGVLAWTGVGNDHVLIGCLYL